MDRSARVLQVALRSAEPALIGWVEELVKWWEAELVVRPPGTPPPPADLHLDSQPERQEGDPSWEGGIAVGLVPAPGAYHLPQDTEELARAIAAAMPRSTARRIGVVGARGGIGASVLAALLARTYAARGWRSSLLDLDCGLDRLLGLEAEPGPRWADLVTEAAPFLGEPLFAALPSWKASHSSPRTTAAIRPTGSTRRWWMRSRHRARW